MHAKRSIFRRLTLIFSVFTILSITVVSGLLYTFAVLQLNRDFYNYNDHLMKNLAEYYTDYLDDLYRFSVQVQKDKPLLRTVRSGEISADTQSDLLVLAADAKLLLVDNLQFYLPAQQKAISVGSVVSETPYNATNQYWYQTLLNTPSGMLAGPGYEKSNAFFTVSFVLSESAPGVPDIILRMDVSKRLAEEIVYMAHLRGDEKLFLYQGSNLLYSNAVWFISREITSYVTSDLSDFTAQGKTYLKSTARTADGLVITKIATQSSFVQVMQPMLVVCLIVILLSVVVSVGFARAAVKTTMANVTRLLFDIERISQGEFSLQPHPEMQDEIGIISKQVSEMAARIEELLNTKYRLMRSEQKALMKALEARVNPHFLNNTLQAISGRAYRNGDYEMCAMINALADMYRYCISPSGSATIFDELENARQYVAIGQFRFGERLQVDFDVDYTALDIHVPRLCMQIPIENSMKYALENVGDDAQIKVIVLYQERTLELVVEDNGAGLDAAALAALRERLRKDDFLSKTNSSTGLVGLAGRLKLIYGEDATMDVDSVKNEFFRTTIRIFNQYGGQSHVDHFID